MTPARYSTRGDDVCSQLSREMEDILQLVPTVAVVAVNAFYEAWLLSIAFASNYFPTRVAFNYFADTTSRSSIPYAVTWITADKFVPYIFSAAATGTIRCHRSDEAAEGSEERLHIRTSLVRAEFPVQHVPEAAVRARFDDNSSLVAEDVGGVVNQLDMEPERY